MNGQFIKWTTKLDFPDTRNSHETRLSSYGNFVESKLWHQRADKDMHTYEYEVSSSTEYYKYAAWNAEEHFSDHTSLESL